MRISDWSSDVCSSDLACGLGKKIRLGQLSMIAGAMLESLMSARLCVAKITDTFFLRSVFDHWRMRAAKDGSSRNSHASSRIRSVGAPSKRSSKRENRKSEERRVGKEWVSPGGNRW